MTMRVDLTGINRDDFNVSERKLGDRTVFLVAPTKAKHNWTAEELHLRSLLTDEDGVVLSAGFPKFRNFGEDAEDDQDFRDAFHRGAFSLSRKLDGSLIIVSNIDGKAHFRTRGNHVLGDFEGPVMTLVKEWYPRLTMFIEDTKDLHFLFEYTAPSNQIVVKYEEPRLDLLAAVSTADGYLDVLWDEFSLQWWGSAMGVTPVDSNFECNAIFFDLLDEVKRAKGVEGIVARFPTLDGRKKLIKVKADEYVKLHAIKFRLEGKVGKLLFLLGSLSFAQARRHLMQLGIDWEAQEFIQDEIRVYMNSLHALAKEFEYFKKCLGLTRSILTDTIEDPTRRRKEYVTMSRGWLQIREGLSLDWFSAAMALYDGDEEKAWLNVVARFLLDESPTAVANWTKNRKGLINEMLSVEVVAD